MGDRKHEECLIESHTVRLWVRTGFMGFGQSAGEIQSIEERGIGSVSRISMQVYKGAGLPTWN